VQDLSDEIVFDLPENESGSGTDFHMNGFRTETRFDREATGNWKIFLYNWEMNTKSKSHKSENKKKENYIRFFEFLKGILIMRQSLLVKLIKSLRQ